MQLRLTVLRYQRQPPRQPLNALFDERGGSIGRGKDSQWQLPDPERFVSSLHALVEHRQGAFRIADQSANGVYLNGQRVGRGNDRALADGDHLTLGEYEIEVRVEDTMSTGAGHLFDMPSEGAPIEPTPRLLAALPSEDSIVLDASRNSEPLSEALQARSDTASEDEDPLGLVGAEPGLDFGAGLGSASDSLDPPPPGQDSLEGMGVTSPETATLLAALGLDRFVTDCTASPVELLQGVSALLREMTAGYAELLRMRRELKDHIGVERPMPWRNANPLESNALDPTEMMAALLRRPVEAARIARGTVDELRAHERAQSAGLQGALRGLLSEFDPVAFEEGQDKSLLERMTPPLRKAALWEQFVEFHDRDPGAVDALVLTTLRSHYARAYEQQDRSLRPTRSDASATPDDRSRR